MSAPRTRGGPPPAKRTRGAARNPQRRRRRNRREEPRPDQRAFWGEVAVLPADSPEIRITDDPAAVPRSLGQPPLPGHEAIAEHYVAAVYDRAVNTASALAAAGGLIDPEALLEIRGD